MPAHAGDDAGGGIPVTADPVKGAAGREEAGTGSGGAGGPGTDTGSGRPGVSQPAFILSERGWQALLLASSAIIVLFSVYCLSQGITIIFMHLYYFPIILLAYHYHRKGVTLSAVLGLVYVALVVWFTFPDMDEVSGALVRFVVFVAIAAVVSVLSEALERTLAEMRRLSGVRESIIQNANVWLMVLDTRGRVLEWNRAAEEMSGYAASEVIGNNEVWKRLYPEKEYRKEITGQITGIIAKDNYFENLQTTIVTKTGEKKTILWNTRGLSGASGAAGNYIAIGVDITDRERFGQVTREYAEWYSTLLRTTRDGYNLVDDTGRLIEVNENYCRMTGFSQEELIGRYISDLDAEERRDIAFTHLQQILATGSDRFETRHRTKGGGTIDVEVSVVLQARTRQLIVFVRDISDRKRAEKEIITKNVMLATQQETSLDGILVVDEAGKILHFNRRFVDIWHIPEEIIASGSDEAAIRSVLCQLADPDGFLERVRYLYTHQMEKSNEEITLLDGRVLDRYSAPMIGPEGKYYGRIWYFRDVTREKNALRQVLLTEARNRVLLGLYDRGPGTAEHDLMNFAMEGSLVCTGSRFGFFGMLSADESVMTVHAWSKDTAEECRTAEKPLEFRIQDLGLLGDCVRKRAPVLINDYAAPRPGKHGYPEGHVPIRRFMMVPLFEKDRIVAVAAVANKDQDYTGDDMDAVLRLYSLMWAIIARNRAEQALRQSEERYRSLFDRSNDAIYIHAISGQFIDANPAALALIGCTREEIVRYSITDLIGEDQVRRARESIRAIIGTGSDSDLLDFRIRRRDGTLFDIETKASLILRDGKPAAIMGIARDITRRKQMQEELIASKRLIESIIDTIPARVFWKDKNLVYLGCNTPFAHDAGYASPQEVIGKDDFQMGWRDQAELYRKDDQEVIESGRSRLFFEEPQTTPLGTTIHLLTSKIPLKDEKGEIIGVLGTYLDISDRKKMEEALRQVNRKLQLMSSITRHDILNQLTALRGYLELSGDYLDNPARQKEFLGKEEKAAATIEAQITFTRDYQELGLQAPSWQPVQAAIRKAAEVLPVKSIRVDIALSGLEIFADPLCEKVFYNLIDNALRYGGPGMTTIRFSASETGQGLVLTCEDDGAGISEADRKQLFSRGFGKNTGLGLFLSREILSITGITITETGEPGKGARFEIVVPKGAYRGLVSGTPGSSP